MLDFIGEGLFLRCIGWRRGGGMPASNDKPVAASDGSSIVITEDPTEAPTVEVSADRTNLIILEAA